MDNKFIPFGHPAFNQTADGKGKPYVHVPKGIGDSRGKACQILTQKALSYYEGLKEKGENVYIDSISYEEFEILSEMDLKKRFLSLEEQEQKEQLDREQDNELAYFQEDEWTQETAEPEPAKTEDMQEQKAAGRRLEGEDTIMNRMAQWKYSKEQKDELHKMIALGMPTKTILAVFYPETDVIKMREIRKTFEALQHSGDQ